MLVFGVNFLIRNISVYGDKVDTFECEQINFNVYIDVVYKKILNSISKKTNSGQPDDSRFSSTVHSFSRLADQTHHGGYVDYSAPSWELQTSIHTWKNLTWAFCQLELKEVFGIIKMIDIMPIPLTYSKTWTI